MHFMPIYQKVFLFVFSLSCLTLVGSTSVAQERLPEDTAAACGAAGGTCQSNDANCYKIGASAGKQYDLLGYCDGSAQQTSCCKIKASSTGPGTDDYCTGTLKGACFNQQEGCKNGGDQVGFCSNIANINSPRICCSTPTSAAANVGKLNYTLLEQVPGQEGLSGDFSLYLQKLYNFTFWAIGVAALFMLTVGGFMYVTSAGNTSRISTAKTIITDSLLGIVVALFAWLFLYVINPDLTEGLTLPNTVSTPVSIGGGGGGTGVPAPADAKAAAQAILAGGTGITLSSSGSCSAASGTAVSPQYTLEQVANGQPVIRCMNGCPGKGACTQTTSVNSQMLIAMIQVAKTYPFTVTSLTGGSHCEAGIPGCKGLSAHYTGNAVDVSTPNKGDWPAIVNAFRTAGSDNSQTFCDSNGKQLPSDRCNEANHIHVAF